MNGSIVPGQRQPRLRHVAAAWSSGPAASPPRTARSSSSNCDPPGEGGVWVVSVKVPTGKGRMIPVDVALRTEGAGHTLQAEWIRLGRLFPALGPRRHPAPRAGGAQPGRGVGLHDHRSGPRCRPPDSTCACPRMSRRKAKPVAAAVRRHTGRVRRRRAPARQRRLDDAVRRRRAHRRRGAAPRPPGTPARAAPTASGWRSTASTWRRRPPRSPTVQRSRRMTGAEILRASIGLDGSGLSRRHRRPRQQLGQRHPRRRPGRPRWRPVTRPDGFDGELRTYQAEALGWLGFLDAAELGGCLALDMGLGKTPTMLAHLARCRGNGAALVVAPAAVVGNWAAEAARFAPGLRVLVHHGADRWSDAALEAQIAKVDIVITTYATAVRDVDVLARVTWGRVVLDEAQAIKNPASDTVPAAAPHPGPQPHRAHRHADRERARRPVGDPRLHQPGPGRVAAGVHRPDVRRRRGRAAGTQRHPRCSAARRPSPRWPPSCPTRSTSSTTAR